MGQKLSSEKTCTGEYYLWTSRVLPVTLSVLIAWILKYPFSVIVRETSLSQPTARKLIHSFREILVVWLIENSCKIGGVGKTVEVDESAFGRRKYAYNRGRLSKIRWVSVEPKNNQYFPYYLKRLELSLIHI